MALSLSDLITPLTRDQVSASLYIIANTLGLRTSAWQPGGMGRTILAVVAQKIADYTGVTVEAVKGGLLRYATGGWLTLLAYSLFDVERIAATPASGAVTVTNASAVTPPAYAAGELIFAHETTGKTYRNSGAVTLTAGTDTEVAIVADEPGTDSDAGTDEITELVTAVDGCTCTNADPVLGADEETDPDLTARCIAKLGALSPNGPALAFHYVATTPDISATSTPITRTNVVTDPDTGDVLVYLATANGAPSAPDVAVVQAAFEEWAEPLCVEATAIASSEVTINVTAQVWIRGSNKTTPEITTAISTALATYLKGLDIGGEVIPPALLGRVDVGTIESVIRNADTGGRVVDVAVTVPASDTTLDANEVAKLGAVSLTITSLT